MLPALEGIFASKALLELVMLSEYLWLSDQSPPNRIQEGPGYDAVVAKLDVVKIDGCFGASYRDRRRGSEWFSG
jgi:hypothetical protein